MTGDGRSARSREERAREAVRGLSRATLDLHFRERLKREFVSGHLTEPRVDPRPVRRVRWWVLAPAAAAAAVLAVVWIGLGPREPSWTVGAATAESVRVDGRALSAVEREEGRSLPAGSTIGVAGGWLEMDLGEILTVQINAGSEVELPAPEEFDPAAPRVRVARGEVLFLTGGAFPGSRLTVETPEGRVEVTGTAFAVYRDADVTCVCVLEGRARVGVSLEDLETIVPGKRKVMFSDGRAPKILDIEPRHREGVESFVRRVRSAGTS